MREVFSCVVTTESELVMGGGGLGGRSDAEGVGGYCRRADARGAECDCHRTWAGGTAGGRTGLGGTLEVH